MKAAKYLVVHHSATHLDVTAEDIDRMHRAKGWRMGGYSHVIERDGRVVEMRGIRQTLAANPPWNSRSIAVCVIGDNTRPGRRWTRKQKQALKGYIEAVQLLMPSIKVVGHSDVPGGRATLCPGLEHEIQILV